MAQDPEKIRRTYDSVATEYSVTFMGEHEKKPKDQEVLQRFAHEVKGRGSVWDLGCGPGQTTRHLQDLGVEVSGMDLSEGLLERARTAHPGLHFQPGNLLELEFQDESIAGAVAFYAIVHFSEEQVDAACREISRVLKPGGLLLLTYHVGDQTIHVEEFLGKATDIDFMLFTTPFIRGCLERSGFEEIDVIERAPYPEVEYQSVRAYVFARKPLRR